MRGFLVANYDLLKHQLGKKLGCQKRAEDLLHETFLRLHDKLSVGVVRSPRAFILRMASNIEIDRWRRDSRVLSTGEVEQLLDIEEAVETPHKQWEDQLALESLLLWIKELSPRRRDILLSVRLDGVSTRELAQRYGISQRMVEKELKWAHEYCARRMEQHGL